VWYRHQQPVATTTITTIVTVVARHHLHPRHRRPAVTAAVVASELDQKLLLHTSRLGGTPKAAEAFLEQDICCLDLLTIVGARRKCSSAALAGRRMSQWKTVYRQRDARTLKIDGTR
jgi:hypothetical protein